MRLPIRSPSFFCPHSPLGVRYRDCVSCPRHRRKFEVTYIATCRRSLDGTINLGPYYIRPRPPQLTPWYRSNLHGVITSNIFPMNYSIAQRT